MAELHRRGLKGYVTLNTLVFTSELADVESLVRRIAEAGVDAVLVQDLGLVRLIRAICPDLPIHASTQMTLTSSQTIAAAPELGVERVVLARECSIDEIRRIRRECDDAAGSFRPRRAVRRLLRPVPDQRIARRPQRQSRPMCASLPVAVRPGLRRPRCRSGRAKISAQPAGPGRLRPDPAAHRRRRLQLQNRRPAEDARVRRQHRRGTTGRRSTPRWPASRAEFTPRDVEEMELSFSRGFSPGWLGGCDHKMLVPATSSSKRGVLLGHVRDVRRDRVVVELADRAVKRGDGVSFDCGLPVDDEQGGRVYEVFVRGKSLTEPVSAGVVELAFAHGAIDFACHQARPAGLEDRRPGADRPAPQNVLFGRSTTANRRRSRRSCGRRRAAARSSRLTETGVTCEITAEEPAAEARKHPLTEETLREQFGRLGGTPFSLRNLTAEIVGRPMVPFSVLGKLRHELVERLEATLRVTCHRAASLPNRPCRRLRPHTSRASASEDVTGRWNADL